jgi:hypothetical protein
MVISAMRVSNIRVPYISCLKNANEAGGAPLTGINGRGDNCGNYIYRCVTTVDVLQGEHKVFP